MTFELKTHPAIAGPRAAPGARVFIRGTIWKVVRIEADGAAERLHCIALTGIAKGKSAIFIDKLEPDLRLLDPTEVEVTPDVSGAFADTKLYLDAAFRSSHFAGGRSLALGRAAIDDLEFQHEPVLRALAQPRVRLLLADDVGLGKTLEAGLVASELVLRKRAGRILVVTTRAMLGQFQKEFWTRFSIPLARLDSSAIRRMRNTLPASYNVFHQFDRVIVSIDTLKKDLQYRIALEDSLWDLIIIDEAHNVAARKAAAGSKSQRAKLANLLARRTDALLLLTATPHDGSPESFSSLIEMLDPTRVPNPDELQRADIEDLVIRRFRSSPEIIRDLRRKVPERIVRECSFRLGEAEDAVHNEIAALNLDSDTTATGKKTGLDLFKVTLAKSIFSSPAACLETIENRLKRVENGQVPATQRDFSKLERLRENVRALRDDDFGKYRELLRLLKDVGWTGAGRRDRLVIFSERISTLDWLAKRLTDDLKLGPDAIGKVDGTSVESDERTQKLLEEFGQEGASVRVLLASDMASEGLNLHFQCHRLIHFDLPWSLLRFQQRNGRIDRYGQERCPEIYYFIGQSSHPRVRDMWVLDKLVAKDAAAQQGIGDPAVFLRAGDIEGEEAVVADAVGRAIGAKAFEAEMDANLRAEADDWDLLFGTYQQAPIETAAAEPLPPRLYPDTFAFATALLSRSFGDGDRLRVDHTERLIELELPNDMRSTDAFGYAKAGDVDDRYMPIESVGPGGRIALTDRIEMIDAAIKQARIDERPWPNIQYLWDAHPIIGWMNERAEALFPQGTVPLCSVGAGLTAAQTAVLLHGVCANRNGVPLLTLWSVAILEGGKVARWIDDIGTFFEAIGFNRQTPNRGGDANAIVSLQPAVHGFQERLLFARRERQQTLNRQTDAIFERLSQFRRRFDAQLALQFSESVEVQQMPSLRSIKERRREERQRRINDMFRDWEAWIDTTCGMVDDPSPYVEVKAVFRG